MRQDDKMKTIILMLKKILQRQLLFYILLI